MAIDELMYRAFGSSPMRFTPTTCAWFSIALA